MSQGAAALTVFRVTLVVRPCHDEISNASKNETLYGASAPTYRVGILAVSAGNQANIGKAIPKANVLIEETGSALVFDLKPWLAAGEVPDSPRRALPYFEEGQSL